jgi:hypothetical protein
MTQMLLTMNVHVLQSKLYHFRIKENDSIASYMNKIKVTVTKLNNLRKKMILSMVMAKIVYTFPPSYGNMLNTCDSVHALEKTFNSL